MAAGSRLTNLDEILSKLTALQERNAQTIDKQNGNIKVIMNSMKDLTWGLQNLDAKIEHYLQKTPNSYTPLQSLARDSPNFSSLGPHEKSDSGIQFKSMRLEVPGFSGDNSSDWISRIQRYFDFYNTPEHQRLLIAPFHLDGDALAWYEWRIMNRLFSSWREFLSAIEKRFGPFEYEDYFGKLSKLMPLDPLQLDSSIESHHLFDQLPNKIVDEKEPRSLNLSVLPPLLPTLPSKIQSPREAAIDEDLDTHEEKHGLSVEETSEPLKWDETLGNSSTISLPPLLPTPFSPIVPQNSELVQTLSAADTRGEKVLCYTCDGKLSVHHLCKGKLFLFMINDMADATQETIIQHNNRETPRAIPEFGCAVRLLGQACLVSATIPEFKGQKHDPVFSLPASPLANQPMFTFFATFICQQINKRDRGGSVKYWCSGTGCRWKKHLGQFHSRCL